LRKFEYVILTRDKAGRWCEQGAGGARPVDLDAVAGPFLEAGATQLNAALLLNGYGLQGWEMVYGSSEGAEELRCLVLKRRVQMLALRAEGDPGAALRRGAALLKGAAVGTLAVGLARLFMTDGAASTEAEENVNGDAIRNGREAPAGRAW
jgi:hypothetical protein